MRTSSGSIVVGLVVGLIVAASARVGWAAEEPRELRHASVEIDTSDIGEEGPVVKRRVRERSDVVLRSAGVLPARPDSTDPLIHVDVDALRGEDPGYRFELWVSRGGEPVGERQRVECPLCTESEVVARVEGLVALVLDEPGTFGPPPTLAVPPKSEPESEPEPEPSSEPAPVVPPAEHEPPAKLSSVGKAGVAMLVVGAVGLGTGAVLVALPAKVDPVDPLYETTTRPPGFVVLGVGAAAAISGVAMLVVDRRRARAGQVALVPALGPSGAGLVLRGRF